MVSHKVGTKTDHNAAREALLAAEKELTRKNDEVSELRRDLPWVQLEQDYKFHGATGAVNFSDLFKDGKKDLVVIHFMYEPEWDNGCSQCSCWAEAYNNQLPFYQERFNFVVVAKAPFEKLSELAERKGWGFPMYSSHGSTFNKDFEVEDTVGKSAGEEFPMSQAPGVSVFRFEDGVLYHTYSAHRRGIEKFNPVRIYLYVCLYVSRTHMLDSHPPVLACVVC